MKLSAQKKAVTFLYSRGPKNIFFSVQRQIESKPLSKNTNSTICQMAWKAF